MENNEFPIWDSITWSEAFLRSQHPVNHYQLKRLRQMVFFNTCQIVKSGGYRLDDGKIVALERNPHIAEQTRLYRQEIHPQAPTGLYKTIISVKQMDCLAYARQLQGHLNEPVCVLNLASATHPGGGVQNGAAAQEEYLFRCSDYYQSLFQFADFGNLYNVIRSQKSYPLDPKFGGVFTPNATVFRDTESTGYALLEKPWKVNFLAVAAINHPQTELVDGEYRLIKSQEELTRLKMRTLFRIAIDNGQRYLVLGALGCGAFANPPHHIAQLFKETLSEPEFQGCFQHITFAIKGGPNGGNFSPFKAVFS